MNVAQTSGVSPKASMTKIHPEGEAESKGNVNYDSQKPDYQTQRTLIDNANNNEEISPDGQTAAGTTQQQQKPMVNIAGSIAKAQVKGAKK